ncbi:hypothetical protein [Thiolapillus sp.]|uniref:hypothetical protein n=1 Tax=Thiolapillus sp. TaxID=2017437 RepID=UPI003AF5D4A2
MGHIPSINYIHVHRTEKTRSNSQTADHVRHKRKKKHWKKKLREAWKNGIYPKELNNEEKKALQEMKETIGKSGLAKL